MHFLMTISGWTYLPAFRWQSVTAYSTFSPSGLFGPLTNPVGALTSIFFQFANFIWRIITELLRIGVGGSFLGISNSSSSVIASINTAFAALGHVLQTGILLPLLLIVALVLLFRAVIKGGMSPGRIVKEALFIILPLGAFFGMVSAASNNASVNSTLKRRKKKRKKKKNKER
jgi:hypothetical protein